MTDFQFRQDVLHVDLRGRLGRSHVHAQRDVAGRPIPENGTRSSMRVRLYYVATATVQFRGLTGGNTATVQRVFVRGGRNLFDNFFFGT